MPFCPFSYNKGTTYMFSDSAKKILVYLFNQCSGFFYFPLHIWRYTGFRIFTVQSILCFAFSASAKKILCSVFLHFPLWRYIGFRIRVSVRFVAYTHDTHTTYARQSFFSQQYNDKKDAKIFLI